MPKNWVLEFNNKFFENYFLRDLNPTSWATESPVRDHSHQVFSSSFRGHHQELLTAERVPKFQISNALVIIYS